MKILYILIILSASSCISKSFPYRFEDPLNVVNFPQGSTETAYGEGTGFLWTSCEAVNAKAIQQLKDQLKPNEKIVQLEWITKHNIFETDTKCTKEVAWAISVYLFWWPSATKVTVRGKIMDSTKLEELVRQKTANDELSAKTEAEAKEHAAKVVAVELKRKTAEAFRRKAESKAAAEKDKREFDALIDLESPLSIEHYSVQPESGNYGQNYVQLILKLKNNGNRRITAYDLQVELKTKLGTKLGRISLSSNSSSILPLRTDKSVYSWKDNPFIDGEFYDQLINVTSENLIVTIINQTVVKDTHRDSH